MLAWPAGDSDRANPYLSLLYTGIVGQRGTWLVLDANRRNIWRTADIVHVHWPEDFATRASRVAAFSRATSVLLVLYWFYVRGSKIVWTVHNIRPHENRYPALQRFFYWQLSRIVSGLVFLTKASRSDFSNLQCQRFSHVPYAIVPHGTYDDAHGSRRKRGLVEVADRASILGSFGQIRSYKNQHGIARWVNSGDGTLLLRIAGEPVDQEVVDCLRREESSLVSVRTGWLDDEQLISFVDEIDALIIGDLSVRNSGTVILALSRNVRVIAPANSSMKEMADAVGEDWIFLYEDLDSILQSEVSDWLACPPLSEPDLTDFGWTNVAKAHVVFFETLIQSCTS